MGAHLPPENAPEARKTLEAARAGRPIGVGTVTFCEGALRLLEQGYEPIPVVPGAKRPALSRWTQVRIDETKVEAWARRYPDHAIGLRTGQLVGVDIDLLDPDLAHEVFRLAEKRLGATLMRVGLWPKRLLLYRSEVPMRKLAAGSVEILGVGQQFVAFGQHPGTGRPYAWPLGETPFEVGLPDLPVVGQAVCEAFLAEAAALQPAPVGRRFGKRTGRPTAGPADVPVRDETGLVIDGRDAWLSMIAFHAVRDRTDAGLPPDLDQLARDVWARFEATTDLGRARQDGDRGYSIADARRKVADKLRLLADGRLPERHSDVVEPVELSPLLDAGTARLQLSEAVER